MLQRLPQLNAAQERQPVGKGVARSCCLGKACSLVKVGVKSLYLAVDLAMVCQGQHANACIHGRLGHGVRGCVGKPVKGVVRMCM